MNPFVKPGEEITSFQYPVFPDPERKKLEFTMTKGVYTGDFVAMDKFKKSTKAEVPVVQPVIYQDFQKVFKSR